MKRFKYHLNAIYDPYLSFIKRNFLLNAQIINAMQKIFWIEKFNPTIKVSKFSCVKKES